MSEKMSELKKPRRKRSTHSGGSYWKNGRLYARIQYQDFTGKRKRKQRPIPSGKMADVKIAIAEMRNELNNIGEEALRSDKMTFAELTEKYKTAKVFSPTIKDGKKIAGLKSYKAVEGYLKTLKEYFAKMPIREIRPFDIEQFKRHRIELKTVHGKSRKIASVNRELSYLRVMLNFALRNDWILQNPCQKVERLVSASHEVERDRVLSYEEEVRLLAALNVRNKHLRPIYICALDTGMRPEEMYKLIWENVDFNTRTINVIAEDSKTETGREVGMTDRLFTELNEMWQKSPMQQNLSVFNTKSVKTAHKTACEEAKISDFRFRDCRHTAITRMVLTRTIQQSEIMKMTGHTQLKTFLRYVNLTKDSASENARKLSEHLDAKFSELEKLAASASVSEAIN